MKKYLVVVLAAITFVLAGCQEGGGNKYTSIRFKNTEITLAQGESMSLNVLYEPTTLDAPVCEWSSSNPAVVKVDANGNIEALEIGEANITAKLGDLEAVCKVSVKDMMDLLKWAGWSIWNFDEEDVLSDTVEVELTIGPTKCVAVPATAFVWDEGLLPVYNEKGQMTGLSGEGFVLEVIDMPIYIIAAGDYAGYYVGSDDLTLVDPAEFNPFDTAYAYCAAAGKLGDAEKFYQFLTDTAAHVDYTECFTGTELSYYNFDAQRGYYWFGLAGEGIYVGDESEIQYKSNVTWFEYQYGLAVVETEEGLDFKQPAEWGNTIDKYYENVSAQSAKKNLRPMKAVKHDKPLMGNRTRIAKDVLFKK